MVTAKFDGIAYGWPCGRGCKAEECHLDRGRNVPVVGPVELVEHAELENGKNVSLECWRFNSVASFGNIAGREEQRWVIAKRG